MSVRTAESDLATKLSAVQQPLIIASGSLFHFIRVCVLPSVFGNCIYTCRGILAAVSKAKCFQMMMGVIFLHVCALQRCRTCTNYNKLCCFL